MTVDWNKEIHRMAAEQDYLYLPGVREAASAITEAVMFIRERDALYAQLTAAEEVVDAVLHMSGPLRYADAYRQKYPKVKVRCPDISLDECPRYRCLLTVGHAGPHEYFGHEA